MAIPVGINGFGRIGRLVARILLQDPERFDLRLVNDLASAEILGRLLERDSTYGRFGEKLDVSGDRIRVNGGELRVTNEKDPSRIPWEEAGVELVLESTGVFRKRDDLEKHLEAGARKVLLSAPTKGDRPLDAMIVLGVNEGVLEPDHRLISNASCTTNCLAPMLKVLDDRFGVEEAMATTVHAYTPSQHLLDGIDDKPTRARSATQNIIPTSTGAAKATIEVLPQLEGKLVAIAMRVPVPTGSVVDLDARLSRAVDVDEVNAAFREGAAGDLKGIVEYTDRELVSSDIVGDPHSAIVDGSFTELLGDRSVKLLGWYDNEWGYAARCVDLLQLLAHSGSGGGSTPGAVS
ncbi:MAG: type I glyceraldehyde-3-phosphate dehydrogenase [bacterium]